MILTSLMSLSLVFSFLTSVPQKENSQISYSDNSNEVFLSKSVNNLSKEDVLNFCLKEDYLDNSTYVLSSKQNIEIEAKTYYAPKGWYFSKDGTLSQTKDDYFKMDSYTEPGGYVTLTTTAYRVGFYDGNFVYCITSQAALNKNFFFEKNDNLIIRQGDNAVFFDELACNGKYSVYDIKNNAHNFLYEEPITPSFSKGDGVLYEFPIIQDTGFGDSYNPRQTIVDGNYYLVATNTTSVQSVYVHNQDLYVDSLSFSFGPVGVNIPLSSQHAAIYYATPLTLPGNDGSITREKYVINPQDYNFEPQYFFSPKTSSHSIDGLTFTTDRLRCGYIEEEYINLSAKRRDSGTAYLEFTFDKKIYQMNAMLTFWSDKELFLVTDKAYVQYMNEDGNWVTTFDLLNNNNPLPTDRNNPKSYEFIFASGTNKIRFYSHTDYPTSSRNKGRICIGQMTLISYSL